MFVVFVAPLIKDTPKYCCQTSPGCLNLFADWCSIVFPFLPANSKLVAEIHNPRSTRERREAVQRIPARDCRHWDGRFSRCHGNPGSGFGCVKVVCKIN